MKIMDNNKYLVILGIDWNIKDIHICLDYLEVSSVEKGTGPLLKEGVAGNKDVFCVAGIILTEVLLTILDVFLLK